MPLRRQRHPAVFALLLLLGTALAPRTLFSMPLPAVEKGKQATALVEIKGFGPERGFGTAFCIDPRGIFITNAHVADAVNTPKLFGGRIHLILHPGEKDEHVFDARVLRSDKDKDLAVLEITGAVPPGLAALKLAAADALQETMEITAFGFPFGSGLSMEAQAYPAVSVNSGRITALRKKAGELELIQVDAALNPGNSGGPVLSAAGEVVGIVKAGVPGAGINFAIPVSHLQKLLAKPVVTIRPTTVPFEEREHERPFTINVISATTRPSHSYSVELELTGNRPDAPPRKFTGETKEGVSTFKVVPVPAAEGAKQLNITAEFANGALTAHMVDLRVKVGEERIDLSTIARIESPAGGTVSTITLTSGRRLTGSLSGLDRVALDFGGLHADLNLSSATRITIRDTVAPVYNLVYAVTVRDGKETVATDRGFVRIDREAFPPPPLFVTGLPPAVHLPTVKPTPATLPVASAAAPSTVTPPAPPPAAPVAVRPSISGRPGRVPDAEKIMFAAPPPVVADDAPAAPPSPVMAPGTGLTGIIDIMGNARLAPDAGPTQTPAVGHPGRTEYDTVRDEHGEFRPRPICGFRYTIGEADNKRPCIRRFEMLFNRFDRGQPDTVVAKDGYVVGGLIADTTDVVHAVQIIFVKSEGGKIDAKDFYVSDWLGTPLSGSAPKLIGGHGEHVVGLCGRRGWNLEAIGLILMP